MSIIVKAKQEVTIAGVKHAAGEEFEVMHDVAVPHMKSGALEVVKLSEQTAKAAGLAPSAPPKPPTV